MNEMIEHVARAIYAVEREGEFPQNELPFDQAFIHDPAGYGQIMGQARAAIDAVRDYLKEHDDGFQCQECNAMVDVDAALCTTK